MISIALTLSIGGAVYMVIFEESQHLSLFRRAFAAVTKGQFVRAPDLPLGCALRRSSAPFGAPRDPSAAPHWAARQKERFEATTRAVVFNSLPLFPWSKRCEANFLKRICFLPFFKIWSALLLRRNAWCFYSCPFFDFILTLAVTVSLRVLSWFQKLAGVYSSTIHSWRESLGLLC